LALSLVASAGTITDETDLRIAPSAWRSCRSVASPVSTAPWPPRGQLPEARSASGSLTPGSWSW
jgi:hypothetical protein